MRAAGERVGTERVSSDQVGTVEGESVAAKRAMVASSASAGERSGSYSARMEVEERDVAASEDVDKRDDDEERCSSGASGGE